MSDHVYAASASGGQSRTLCSSPCPQRRRRAQIRLARRSFRLGAAPRCRSRPPMPSGPPPRRLHSAVLAHRAHTHRVRGRVAPRHRYMRRSSRLALLDGLPRRAVAFVGCPASRRSIFSTREDPPALLYWAFLRSPDRPSNSACAALRSPPAPPRRRGPSLICRRRVEPSPCDRLALSSRTSASASPCAGFSRYALRADRWRAPDAGPRRAEEHRRHRPASIAMAMTSPCPCVSRLFDRARLTAPNRDRRGGAPRVRAALWSDYCPPLDLARRHHCR